MEVGVTDEKETEKNKKRCNKPSVCYVYIDIRILFITLEYYNIYTHQDFINTELDRNLNLTLNSSVKDSAIMSGNFEIDENKINENINNYFIQDMGCKAKVVSGDMVKKWQKTNDEGVWQYDINVDKITFDKDSYGQSPKITIEGSMTYYPMCVKNIIKSDTNTKGTITMPFKREVQNNINAG